MLISAYHSTYIYGTRAGALRGYKCLVLGMCPHRIVFRRGAAVLPDPEHFGAIRGVLWAIMVHESFMAMGLSVEDVRPHGACALRLRVLPK